ACESRTAELFFRGQRHDHSGAPRDALRAEVRVLSRLVRRGGRSGRDSDGSGSCSGLLPPDPPQLTTARELLAILWLALGFGPQLPSLLHPDAPEMNRTAPSEYSVSLATTKGPIVIDVHRAWAPHGGDRFFNLVAAGYYDDNRFFRVVKGRW